MLYPNRSPNSDNEKQKPDGGTEEENEKETETSKMHLDPPPVIRGAPMDVDHADSFIYVSDEDDNDSNFGSGEYDMATDGEEDLIQLDPDGEAANTAGTNIPHLPSVPSAPPTQPRGPNGTSNSHSLVPPSSTITIPPPRTRSSVTGSDTPHPLAPFPTFPIPSTQTRSSTGTDISRPFAAPPSFASVAALPQTKGSAPPSPHLSVATRGTLPWQSGLMSMSIEPPGGPPPVYTPRAQPLCVVCNERPAYNDGRRAFPTCGNTCARALQAAKLEATKTTPARSNSYSYGSGGSNGNRSSTSPYQTRQTTIKMCEVCHVRPKCQKNGKVFPTCGLTCAAKLQSPGSGEMCEFCGERPKAVHNGQKFPHCGTTCRDKAKTAELASANAATCKTCLICWQAESLGESDFCSDACGDVAAKKAPFLLEVPRGHVAFKKVSDIYTSEWKKPRTPPPGIKKVYMVVMKPDFQHAYEEYRRKVPSHPSFKRKGNQKRVWIGLRRDCGFGDAGNMEPCASKKCTVCSLVRSSVSKEAAQQGIWSTLSLARAIEVSSQIRKRTSKVVLLADVIFGRKAEMTKSEFELATKLPPQGYESVHLVRYGILGGMTDCEELLVFNGDAVKPLYLITHE